MACFSSLVSLEKSISQILDHGRCSISPYQKQLIISLDKYAISFQAFLEDYPEKAKKIEARIRDIAAEAEDIMEWVMMEQIRPSFRWIGVLRRIKFGLKLKKVIDEMDSIAEEMAETTENISILVNDERVDHHSLKPSSSSSSTTQIPDSGKTEMVGFNEDLIEIMDRLCGNSPQLQIIPIFGMGGIGKTTLARNAYDNPLIVEYFDIRAWFTVSQDFSERSILLGLLDATKKLDPESTNESMAAERNESLAEIPELSNSDMEGKVYRALIGRRFLIVMDDTWSTEALDYAKSFIPNGTDGSRIMLTTRLANVAAYANSAIPFHEMRLMDPDQSWHLLRHNIAPQQKHNIPLELESTGKEIARSCGGLPLAIVVVAGLLSTVNLSLTSWKEIARNVRSSVATTVKDGQMEKILSLSYNHLPLHLRPCFLYMGGFPEDHEIKVTSLFRLWLAEGFVKTVASKSFEDSAEEYLEDLVERSLVKVVQRKSNGKIKSCSLHDLVREMCIKISKEEKFLLHITGSGWLKGKKAKGQRRISVSYSDLNSFAYTFSSNTRTMMYFQDTLSSFGGGFRLLRVLDVLKARYDSRYLPDHFFRLYHLRYLAFCYNRKIPKAISNLQNLQTLIIKASQYRSLPYEIWNMPQLRHLVISGCELFFPSNAAPSLNLYSLQNLQTLGKVKNLRCSMSILNMLPNLKKLRLTFFLGSGDLFLHNIEHLSRLEKLQLELETDWTGSGNYDHLVVPSSLKKLTLIGWGRYKPFLTVGPTPNLQVLKLIKYSFDKKHWTTNESDYPQLKFLVLDGLNIVQWNILSSHFPRLKVLMIRACWRLFKLPDELGEIPTLELIEVKLCSKSLADSARDLLEEKRSYGDDAFQVRCINCEDINELKEVQFSKSLESVRKPKQVMRTRKLSYREKKHVALRHFPRPEPRLLLDSREAEFKIVDYKDADLEL